MSITEHRVGSLHATARTTFIYIPSPARAGSNGATLPAVLIQGSGCTRYSRLEREGYKNYNTFAQSGHCL